MPPRRKKVLAGLIVLGVLLIAGGAFFIYKHNQDKAAVATKKPADSQQQTINNAPATPEEQKSSEDSKDQIIAQQQAENSGNTNSGSATPVITGAGPDQDNSSQITVTSYVNGVIEDGGTCTMTATNGSAKVTRTATAVANVSNTVCPAFTVDKSVFTPSGTWNVIVSYASAKATGSSTAKQITIP